MTKDKDAKPRKTTDYVVLQKDASGYWTARPEPIAAITALDAMKQFVALGSDASEFVAVPARSWKPMQRSVEQVQKESWS